MKTLQEIINQESVFLNDFSDKRGVLLEFSGEQWGWDAEEEEDFMNRNKDVNILFASYGYANYSGDAWVLLEQGGKLYEINGGHCSCYGLEGQWSPDEVSLRELEHRLLQGTWGQDDWSDNNFKEELCSFLDVEFVRNR